MSLHLSCKKCGKFLGGIWPDETKSYEWNKENIFDPFFTANAKALCDNFKECPYGSD